MQELKVKLSDAYAEKDNMRVELDLLDMEKIKLNKVIEEKDIEYKKLFEDKENLRLTLEAKIQMYNQLGKLRIYFYSLLLTKFGIYYLLLELRSKQYIHRIRDEHKRVRKDMGFEAERFQMTYEDLHSRTTTICQKYQELLLQRIESQKGETNLNKKIHSLE